MFGYHKHIIIMGRKSEIAIFYIYSSSDAGSVGLSDRAGLFKIQKRSTEGA